MTKLQLSKKFRVENNNLDISALISDSGLSAKKISEIGFSHRKERDRKATTEKEFKYVQISDIDVHLGRIKSYRKFKGSEAPNNARRIMQYGDLLISTRRPTRGAIVTIPKEFDQEICTVFFTSLTINDWNEVDPWYLALFLRTSLARFQFQSLITETAYPVISDEDVESITVLFPSIDIQRKIAKKYDEEVSEFFRRLNEAYTLITESRQSIENLILAERAETIETPNFGLELEEIIDVNGSSIENEVNDQ